MLGINTAVFIFFQIRGMHTLIRDAKTTKHDFVFYADRLIRLVSSVPIESLRYQWLTLLLEIVQKVSVWFLFLVHDFLTLDLGC